VGALTAQYGFNLRPCELCLIQRVPFVLTIILGLLAYFWTAKRIPLIALSGVTYLVNSAIATFHSGVERKWWAGLTGCTTPDMSGSIEDLMKRIQETAVVRCDEIPWSFLGLSMANYNVVFCLGLGLACGVYICAKFCWKN
jgi:disulfide bond formation protein DsbB